MKKLETRFVWVPSRDGAIVYVKEIWKSKFFGVTRQQNIAMFYADNKYGQQWDYKTAVNLAKDYIKRLNRSKPMADEWKSQYLDLIHNYEHAIFMENYQQAEGYKAAMDQLLEIIGKDNGE